MFLLGSISNLQAIFFSCKSGWCGLSATLDSNQYQHSLHRNRLIYLNHVSKRGRWYVRLLWDANFLYVSIWCQLPSSLISMTSSQSTCQRSHTTDIQANMTCTGSRFIHCINTLLKFIISRSQVRTHSSIPPSSSHGAEAHCLHIFIPVDFFSNIQCYFSYIAIILP